MQTDNEKYNEKAQPNTAFMNELKNKLPEFLRRMALLIWKNLWDS